MNNPFERRITIGSIASVMRIPMKSILYTLDTAVPVVIEDFLKRISESENILYKKCEEYGKNKPHFAENGSWYVFDSIRTLRGVYQCVYKLTHPIL